MTSYQFFTSQLMMRNLFILMTTWVAGAFGFYLISFEIKYMPGSLYVNVLMSSIAEAMGKIFGNYQVKSLGI